MSTIPSPVPENLEAASFSYTEWRQRFLNLILRGAIIVGLLVAIAASVDTKPVLVVLYVVSYLTILFVTLVSLPYQVRAVSFLAVIMAVAVASLLETGIRADARLFLLAFVVMTAMLFGPRAGIIASGVSLIPVFIIGYFILTRQYTIISTTVGGNTEVITWIVAVLVLVLVETLILTGLTMLQHGFDTALQQSRRLFETVQVERATLEQRVDQRTAQIRTSAEVGQAVAATLDRGQLLRQVVNLISERFGFYYTAVFTLNDTGTVAVLREATGEAGRILKESGHQLAVDERSMVGYAVTQRKARIALDVGADPVRFANPLLPDTRSEIALPLIAGNRVLGALDVQSTQAAAFDESSAEGLQSMADTIAVALNNAELFRQAEQQAARQSQLNRLSRDLFSAAQVDELYRMLATGLGSIVPHDYLSVTLAQAETDTLCEYELHANTEPVVTEGPMRSSDHTLSGRAYNTHRLAISTDTRADASKLEDMDDLQKIGFRSALCLPLNLGERTVGTLNFASRSPDAFSALDPALPDQLARPIAAALENVRLSQAQQRVLRDFEALNRQLTGQAWEEQFQRLPGQLETLRYDRNGIAAQLPAALPEVELAVETKQPVAWTKIDGEELPTPYQASLAAPIILRGEVLGVLQIGEMNQPRAWSEDDITFMQAVADQVALAMDNARLIEDTRRRAERERVVAEISGRMFAQNDLESIVEIAATELGRVLHLSRAAIQVGMGSNANLAAAGDRLTTESAK